MRRPVRALRLDAAGVPLDGVAPVLEALSAALGGAGPALLPVPVHAAEEQDPSRAVGGVADDVALLLATSGSSGTPRLVELTAPALQASAEASRARLGGAGQWLWSLPLTHVAGWQVLVRGLLSGRPPLLAPGGGPQWPATVADVLAAPAAGVHDVHDHRGVGHGAGEGRRYAALVPTQLGRLLEHPPAAAALAGLDAVLLGGASAPPALLRRAAAAGVRVVAGYGMTETSGGCVYDGVPLDGVDVRVDGSGRVHLAGVVLARGYHGGPATTGGAGGGFLLEHGRRWFATPDAGRLDADGRLVVLGRLDDVLVTGGEKVAPAAVEAALADLDGVAEALVVGVPDAEWGQAVVALVVPSGTPPDATAPNLDLARAHVTARLGRAAAPRHVLVVADLPRRGPGKPDRRAAAALAARLLGRRAGTARP